MSGLSNNSGVQQEHHRLSGKSKRSPPKVQQFGLKDSYEGQVILKDKFLSQGASDIRIKLQQLEKQDPAASLDKMVQTAINTFYNRTGEGDQGSGKGEKERDKACPDAGHPPGKPYGKPRVLEGQGMR